MSTESTPAVETLIPQQPADEFDDVDFDVEGHGLREVTVALGAASVVLGGAGIALAGQHTPFDRTVGSAQSTISAAAEESDAVADSTVETAAGAVDHTVDVTTRTATTTATTAGTAVTDTHRTHVAPKVRTATGVATDVATYAGEVRQDPVGESDALVDGAWDGTKQLRGKALTKAGDAVASVPGTVAGVQTTVDRHASVEADGDSASVQANAGGKTAGATVGFTAR